MAKFLRPKAGEWVQPKKCNYKLMCCDCGLVHRMDFRHVVKVGNHAIASKGGKVQFRCWRDSKSTGAARAAMTKSLAAHGHLSPSSNTRRDNQTVTQA